MPPKPAKTTAKKTTKKTPHGTAKKASVKSAAASKAAAAAQASKGSDPGMSDAAVRKATGKTWEEWLAILDKAGAQGMKHGEIAALLHEEHGVGEWWSQMVTVGYERARGLREKHQTPSGYQISGNKTINAPVRAVFEAWNDAKIRRRWLAEEITIRKATVDKSLWVTWSDGSTHVDVNLYAKGEAKAQVSVEHRKIADAKRAGELKAMWAERLGVLKGMLEG